MAILENPITLWRKRNGFTKRSLASELGLSTTQLSKIEQATYETLPESLTVLTGISNETYHRYRSMKRRNAELNCQLDKFISPSDFRLWRQKIAWERFLSPSPTTFAALVCVNVNYLVRFENSPDYATLPPAVAVALRECGVTFYEQLALDLTNA